MLSELNPELPDEAYNDAVRQITATEASGTITSINREKYDPLRDGVQAAFTDASGQRTKERLRAFDFTAPEKNDFLCVRELWIRDSAFGHPKFYRHFSKGNT